MAKGASVSKQSRLQNIHVGILRIAIDKITSFEDEQLGFEHQRPINQINHPNVEHMNEIIEENLKKTSPSASGVESETTANSPPSFDTQASPMDDKTREEKTRKF